MAVAMALVVEAGVATVPGDINFFLSLIWLQFLAGEDVSRGVVRKAAGYFFRQSSEGFRGTLKEPGALVRKKLPQLKQEAG